MQLVEIDPDMARLYLDERAQNRNVSRATITAYADDMRSGRWAINGSTIVVDQDGRLIDGQHRLEACVEAGVAFSTYLVQVDSQAMHTIDTGRKRTVGDALTIAGHSYGKDAASALRLLVALARNDLGAKVTSGRALEIVANHPHLLSSAEAAKHPAAAAHIAPSAATAFYYLASQEDAPRAAAALRVMASSEPDYPGDPMRAAREYIVADKLRSRRALPTEDQLRVLLYAWRPFRKKIPHTRILRNALETELTAAQRALLVDFV